MDKTEREAALEEAAKFCEHLGDMEGCEDFAEMLASGIRYLKKQEPRKFRS